MRLITDLFAYCAERIPHWNTISISGYHIREAGSTAVAGARLHAGERHRLRARRPSTAGLDVDEFARAALVLLQRAQQLLRGGGQVPRGAAAVGADHARALRRDEPARADAALPRPDRRLDAHRAAAGEQHRARRDPGAVGGARRRAEPAHERFDEALALPTEHAAHDRAAHAADHRRGGGRGRHRRSARRLLLRRGADRRARGARAGADRAGRRDGRRRRGGRVGLRAGRDRARRRSTTSSRSRRASRSSSA